MDRLEFLPVYFRGAGGTIEQTEMFKSEPTPYAVPADLYCGSYQVTKGLLGPPKIGNIEIVIFNTRTYRPDSELEEFVKDRLTEAISSKEGPEVVEASGGLAALRSRIKVSTWWGPRGER